MTRTFRQLLLSVALIPILFSCATSNMGRSWVAPDASGTQFTKLGIVAFTQQEVYRREAEYALQQELRERGVSSYMLLPELKSLRDTANVVATLKEAGCDGIVTLQLKSGAVQPDNKPRVAAAPSYGEVSDDYWVDPSAQTTEGFANGQFFSVEVHVFDLNKRKMVYNGLVIEQNAKDAADLVRLVRRNVMEDLKSKGVVKETN